MYWSCHTLCCVHFFIQMPILIHRHLSPTTYNILCNWLSKFTAFSLSAGSHTSWEWTTTQKHYCTDLHYHRAMLGHPCKMWKSSHKSLICSRGWEPGKKQSQLWAIEKPEDRQEEAWRQTGRSLETDRKKPGDRQGEAWRQTGRSLETDRKKPWDKQEEALLLTQETTTLTCTPPTAHNTRMAPSRTLRALSTSTVKSTCPDDCEHFVSKFKALKIH